MADEFTSKLDAYLDGELAGADMKALDAHVRACPACAADVLGRVQMKRAIKSASQRYEPRSEFRAKIERRLKPRAGFPKMFRAWAYAAAVACLLFVVAVGYNYYQRERLAGERLASEIVDLHVAALADPNPVQVPSSDRHTVKPWFQGKIPFTFDLPELQNTGFTLLGGRLTYLDQTAGAELIYQVRKHYISVFIFPQQSSGQTTDLAAKSKHAAFSLQSFTHQGLRYVLISDTGDSDLGRLSDLLKSAQRE
jgi:anti-sigma factor RsiW